MAHAVTIDGRRANILHRVTRRGVLTGKIDITAYDNTNPEITEITRYFRQIDRVVFGTSDSGYIAEWKDSTKGIIAWAPTQETGVVANRSGAVAANGVDVGEFDFIAFGQVR